MTLKTSIRQKEMCKIRADEKGNVKNKSTRKGNVRTNCKFSPWLNCEENAKFFFCSKKASNSAIAIWPKLSNKRK